MAIAPTLGSWQNFNHWWHAQSVEGNTESFKSLFTDHPLFTTAMGMNKSITGVIDLHAMKYLYWSGNVIELSGWEDNLFWEGGLQFTYSKFHTDDLLSFEYFGQLIFSYYKLLPEEQKTLYKGYWDFRMFRKDGHCIRILRQDCVLKHDAEGNPAMLLILVTDITQLKADNKSHLRMTNGIDYQLHEYNTIDKKLYKLDNPSERELAVFRHISQGYQRRQIADKLGITLATVKTHCQHVYEKLRTNDSVETINLLKIWGLL